MIHLLICAAAVPPHLFVFLHVPDLHLTPQVPKAGQDQYVALRTGNRQDYDPTGLCELLTTVRMPLFGPEHQKRLSY